MSQASLPPEILSLPIPQRVHLVEQIWDSIVEDEQGFELTTEQKKELDRRLDSHQASPKSGKSWEEVKSRLLGEL